jgi:hypothetical protein
MLVPSGGLHCRIRESYGKFLISERGRYYHALIEANIVRQQAVFLVNQVPLISHQQSGDPASRA